ncbi:MAG TPA: flagellar type III secretion system pore protein FliP [Clostridiales bacterium]|jgi:flagellar biosynthetic protein FliP|nr:flagellar type III secretion system pore protein FliP [Clostridiales bacterium]
MKSEVSLGRHTDCSPKGKWNKILITAAIAVVLLTILLPVTASAAGINIDLNTDGSDGTLGSLQLLFLFALIALAPSLLIMMTCFTRIVIVFSLLRNAIGLQQTPPNQVLIGLALFLSLFIMSPVLKDINEQGLQPYINEEITQEVALDNMKKPIKRFMLKQIKEDDLNLFLSLSGDKYDVDISDTESLLSLGLDVIVPSFITSELKRAFTMGFLLFLPFLIIDMIVASTLMSMGMVMLPPSMISLPFKLMLFVVVNGWSLIIEMLVKSFY